MPRTALLVSYNGSRFHGWQMQAAGVRTVQGELTRAVSTVADAAVTLHCAGRTDTGVHATKQVIHFDSPVARPVKAWVMGVNAHLPDDISVAWANAVPQHFDARHSATARHYRYLVHNQRVRSAIMPEYLTREHRQLDAARMHEAGQALLGENDFSSFRAAGCQSRTPMRNVMALSVMRRDDLVMIDVRANAFLHHMVRNIVGVLLDVGAGEYPVSWPAELLALRDRRLGSVTAPPNGLFLIDVHYPGEFELPAGPVLPHLLGQPG